MAKKPKTTNAFTQAVNDTLEFLRDEVFAVHLLPFKAGPPLLELFVFSDLAAIRSHIMGAPRAALHTALHNPQTYLQCDCCVIDNATQITSTLPDLSIVYKLHLESGHMINLFDWMQAFRSIVDNDNDAASDDEDTEISPHIQYPFLKPKTFTFQQHILSVHFYSLHHSNPSRFAELALHVPLPNCSFLASSKAQRGRRIMWPV